MLPESVILCREPVNAVAADATVNALPLVSESAVIAATVVVDAVLFRLMTPSPDRLFAFTACGTAVSGFLGAISESAPTVTPR